MKLIFYPKLLIDYLLTPKSIYLHKDKNR